MVAPREAIRQILEGHDFEPAHRLLRDLTVEQAMSVLPGFPYSIATLVAHMDFWQQTWLSRLSGATLGSVERGQDWPAPTANQWRELREQFLLGLERAVAESERGNLDRVEPNGQTAESELIRLAIHNSYHLGQIALIRQLLSSWPPEGGSDAW